MCLSATANFVGGSIVGAVGVVTLQAARRWRRGLLLASVPVLFAAHQLIEGVVWLGLQGRAPPWLLDLSAEIYMVYAQGVLPILVPLAVWLIEPSRTCRRRILPFVVAGIGLGAYIFAAIIRFPTEAYVEYHSIVYDNVGTEHLWVAIGYVLITTGAFLVSGYRWLVVFGVANLIGLSAVAAVRSYAFTSIWCAYAAAVSVVLYAFFRSGRRSAAPVVTGVGG